MAAIPLLEEVSGGPSGAMIAGLAGLPLKPAELARIEMADDGRPQRKLAIYQASAGFDLVEELVDLVLVPLRAAIPKSISRMVSPSGRMMQRSSSAG